MDKVKIAKRVISWFFDFNLRMRLNKKIRKIIHYQAERGRWINPPHLILMQYRALWRRLGRNPNPDWLKTYGNITGLWDHRYIPESLYYEVVEPCLNNKSFAKSFSDKNLYSLLLRSFNLPEVVVSNIDGVLYNSLLEPITPKMAADLILSNERIIVKPSVDSGGGKDIGLWSVDRGGLASSTGARVSTEDIFVKYGSNFVIQKVIEQHSFYKQFNASSVNTVRMFTYRSPTDESIHILHTVLRVGAPGRITDNQASGGFACGVNEEGRITGKAVDKYGKSYTGVNNIELEKGLKLEGFDELSKCAITVASHFYYSRLLGFDLCIDSDRKVRIIEVNNLNHEINFFQMLDGPLFKEFTEEVVSWCSKRSRSFLIDYELQ